MDVALVCAAVFWIYVFPASDGMSSTFSSHAIVTGHKIYFHKHCQLEFREYMQTCEYGDNTIITESTSGAIYLWPTENVQGIWRFMSLVSGW